MCFHSRNKSADRCGLSVGSCGSRFLAFNATPVKILQTVMDRRVPFAYYYYYYYYIVIMSLKERYTLDLSRVRDGWMDGRTLERTHSPASQLGFRFKKFMNFL
jgi:hypothetical protein